VRQGKLIKVRITDAAKKIIERSSDDFGLTEIALFSRLVDWYSRQDDVVKRAVLDMLPPEYRTDIAKLVLERMASDKRKE
jgi:hypothetical protein